MTTEVPEWEENLYEEDDVESEAALDDATLTEHFEDNSLWEEEPDVDIAILQVEADAAEPGEFEGTEGLPA